MSYHRGSINTLQNASIWRYGSTKTVSAPTLVLAWGDFADKITTMYFRGMTKPSAYFLTWLTGASRRGTDPNASRETSRRGSRSPAVRGCFPVATSSDPRGGRTYGRRADSRTPWFRRATACAI